MIESAEVSEPSDSDREWAYVLDGQDSDRLRTVVAHRLECQRAERERILTALERLIDRITKHGSPRIRAFIADMRKKGAP